MNLRQQNKSRKQRLDQKALKLIDYLIDPDNDLARTKTLECLQNLRQWFDDHGFLTENQRKLARKINKEFKEDYPYHTELMERLVKYRNDGHTNPESEDWIVKTVGFFKEHHSITPLQQEQVITIVDKISGQLGDD